MSNKRHKYKWALFAVSSLFIVSMSIHSAEDAGHHDHSAQHEASCHLQCNSLHSALLKVVSETAIDLKLTWIELSEWLGLSSVFADDIYHPPIV